jgi:hypothetical protein
MKITVGCSFAIFVCLRDFVKPLSFEKRQICRIYQMVRTAYCVMSGSGVTIANP